MLIMIFTTIRGNYLESLITSNTYYKLIFYRVPALSINNHEHKVIPYPENEEINEDKIKTWLNKFVKG
jgi:hypothetical protein